MTGHLFLCGMMGAGKSTVGKLLAETLSLPFIDLDEMIVEKEKMAISKIFLDYGEDYFRECEKDALNLLIKEPRSVIALGGGSIIEPENKKIVLQHGNLIYLKVRLETIELRLKMEEREKRPLLQKHDISELLEKRSKIYEENSLIISADRFPEDVVDNIVGRLDA